MIPARAILAPPVLSIIVAVTGASLQILTTLPLGTLGVRVSIADLILPILLMALLLARRLSRREIVFPTWLICSLSLLTIWFGVSIVVGRIEIGYWESWAIINRGAGWLVLMGFLSAGWILVEENEKLAVVALRTFLIGSWVSTLFSTALMLIIRLEIAGITAINEPDANAWQQLLGLITGSSRFQGFFVNPNAFGFFLAILVCIQMSFLGSRQLFERHVQIIGLSINLFGLLFTFSRGAWLGVAAGIVLLAILRRIDLRASITAILIASSASLVLFLCLAYLIPTTGGAAISPVAAFSALTDQSISHRWILFDRAIELWGQRPLVGNGIGSFIAIEPTLAGQRATIHSTYLWLLTETGLIGLTLAAFFAIGAFATLIRVAFESKKNNLAAAGASIILCSTIVALVMEVLYQRHFWFLLGVTLAASVARRDASDVT